MKFIVFFLIFLLSSATAFARKCHFAFSCKNQNKTIYHTSSASGVQAARSYCAEDKNDLCTNLTEKSKSGCATNSKNEFVDPCAVFVCNTYLGSYKLGREFYSEDEIKNALKLRMDRMITLGECAL